MPLILDGALRREVTGVVDILQFSEYISARQYIHGNGNNFSWRLDNIIIGYKMLSYYSTFNIH